LPQDRVWETLLFRALNLDPTKMYYIEKIVEVMALTMEMSSKMEGRQEEARSGGTSGDSSFRAF
jgi:hypothetical protein